MLECFPQLKEDDVINTSMGASGEDVKLSPKAREYLPVSFEAKNVEKVNVWTAYAQACANAKTYEPILVIKKNHKDPLAIMDLDFFLDLMKMKETHV